ncbi:MAG TPA: riboflavin synthase [Candidatus Bathyarchaeia archaeon]|nr:riboflavin synthase [Candidatus Bathyarchaeia archaeon]
MFTGIVEEIGTLAEIKGGQQASQLTIRAKKVLEDVQLGDSISVNGVCLTVTSFTARQFSVDVMPETLKKTNLSELQHGHPVNLERAMAMGGRFGGHIVSGHVDGTGTVISRETYANAVLFRIQASPELLRYMVPRGSITVDGVSLTIVDVWEQGFSISLIPHTLAHTSIRERKAGDRVNLECDIIGKYVERLLHFPAHARSEQSSKLDMDYLKLHGFA